jgi:vitamin B12 transporter
MSVRNLSVRPSARPVVSVAWLVLTLTTTFPAQAQPALLSTVVVTGSREPTALDRLVGDVVLIDAQLVRDANADSLEDLLRREGGIQLLRTGGPGQSASVMVRGASANSVVVLIDGVRIGSATLGQTDLAGLDLAMVERIEILRGPASSLYGADAVGGVVQIITRRGSGAAHLGAHAAVGGLGSRLAQLSLGGATSVWDYAASVGHEQSDGVSALRPGDAFGNYNPDRDGFERDSAHLRGGLTIAPGHRIGASLQRTRLRSQYDASEFLPPDFVPDAKPDFRSRLDLQIGSIDYRGALSSHWVSTVQLSTQLDALVTGANAPDEYRTRRRQFTWQNALTPSPGQQIVTAVERLDETVHATPYAGRAERDNTALVLGYTGAFGAHRLQADVRHDRNSVHGNVDTGKLGWSIGLRPGLTLRVVAGTSFRAPSFNELFYPGYGVATLQPERSRSVEAGLQWQTEDSAAGVTLYRNRVRELIAYEPDRAFCPADPSFDFGCARNIDSARLQGASFSASRRSGAFGLRLVWDLLDARDSASGQRLTRRAAHQTQLEADWTSGRAGLGATLLAVGARPEAGDTLAAYQTLDLQARWRLSPTWRLEARLLNAFDRDYEPARDYQSIGRQAWLGVRYQGEGL